MGNCTGKPYTSFSKLEEEKDRDTEWYVKEQAREAAFEMAPTEKGMYDARLRLVTYIAILEDFGYPCPIVNVVSRMSDAQVEMAIIVTRLDER